jgi:hypothetical protein
MKNLPGASNTITSSIIINMKKKAASKQKESETLGSKTLFIK